MSSERGRDPALLGWYPFRKWLSATAGQHPGVPRSGEPGWCWGRCAHPGAVVQSLPGWGVQVSTSPREGRGHGGVVAASESGREDRVADERLDRCASAAHARAGGPPARWTAGGEVPRESRAARRAPVTVQARRALVGPHR